MLVLSYLTFYICTDVSVFFVDNFTVFLMHCKNKSIFGPFSSADILLHLIKYKTNLQDMGSWFKSITSYYWLTSFIGRLFNLKLDILSPGTLGLNVKNVSQQVAVMCDEANTEFYYLFYMKHGVNRIILSTRSSQRHPVTIYKDSLWPEGRTDGRTLIAQFTMLALACSAHCSH